MSFENKSPIFYCNGPQTDTGIKLPLALISVKGLELAFVAMILKRAPCNPPVLPHRHTAEINSIALGLAQEFILLGGHDLR